MNSLIDYIFPRVCHACGAVLRADELFVCEPCCSELPRTLYHRIRNNAMEQRFAGLIPFERATGFLSYSRDSIVARIVHDFKYRRFRGLARRMGALMGTELYSTGFFSDIDVLIPIPMHFFKQAKRGYNPAEQLAIGLSAETGIPTMNNLKARRAHRTQTSLTLQERRENTANLFVIKDEEQLKGKHILLIDDICTTGSTLLAAAEVCHKYIPDCRISMLTFGVT